MSKDDCFYCGLPKRGYDHSDCGQDYDYDKDRPTSEDDEEEDVAA